MHYATSRIQPPSYSTHKKQAAAVQKVQQASDRDGEKLSPIDLSIREATLVQLPPLNWAHYYSTPTSMLVRNTGFTVMIHAKYEHEMPYVSSGPLTDNYVFSQIHFHWGEHNETGSGHAVDGIRYPLEMHVIHLKKDYTTLGEALESKDGIAVMVHLYALREERNIQLDQLTAVLQFIQRCKCCARLCPTPLSEIVHPFTSDYFLYWGAVGSPKGQYRILWFISRNVLPISAQQLKEFRQLYDPEGELLLTNSSKPQPLSGRSLFLVSPSERTNVTMYGVSRQAVQSEMYLESDESIDIRNAEYKSLAALDDNEYENCKVCPIPKRMKHTANINVGRPFKVNEGDTSVEESCIDLGNSADDSRVTVKTEMKYKDNSKRQKVITNVNVTTCKHNCKARYSPSEAVYSIVSTRGSELHLKRKSNLVRQVDRSVEQACMLLSGRPSAHPTYSAPSLTSTGGYLTVKQEHTNLSGPPLTNFSSELAVTNRDSDSVVNKGVENRKQKPHRDQIYTIYNPDLDEYEYETIHEEISNDARKSKKVTIKGFEGPNGRFNTNHKNGQYGPIQDNSWTENLKVSTIPNQDTSVHHNQTNTKLKGRDRYYMTEEEKEISQEATQRKLFLVHQIQKKPPYYKVVGQSPTSKVYQPDVVENIPNYNNDNTQNKYTGQALLKTDESDLKTTKQQIVNDPMKPGYQVFYQNEYYTEKDNEEQTKKELYFKENIPFYPVPTSHNTEKCMLNHRKENKRPQQRENEEDPHCRVSLVVRTIVSDHRKRGYKKKESKIPKYIVTKISPADKTNHIVPTKTSDLDIKQCYGVKQIPEVMENVYYAKRINKENQKDLNNNSEDIHSLQSFMDDYYENCMEKEHKEHTKTQVVIKKNQNVKSNPQNNKQQLHPNLKRNGSKQLPPSQDSWLQKPPSREAETQNKLVNQDTKGNSEDVKKHISGEIYQEEIKDSNLTQKINVYHGKKEPDEHIHIIDKTITGTVGKSQSTEVLFQSKHIEAVSPRKTDTEKQINYNLVKSKHPETQFYLKEPPNKTQPSTVICQNISLDQQIKGHAQIRHKVEYHENKKMKTTDVSEKSNNQKTQDNAIKNKKIHGVEETYDESSQEQSSTYYKSKQQTVQQFQPVLQRYDADNSNNTKINNNLNQSDTEQNIQGTLKHSLIEPNKTLIGAQTNSTERTSQVMDSSGFSKGTGIQKLTDTEDPPKSKLNHQQDKHLVSHEYDQSNHNRYAYKEENSQNKHIEHSSYKKNFTHKKTRDSRKEI
uniref:Alpha-carbonic anhydrase domain-containing protein n=1 Tax=Cuerna arida TaxID=1464854 RepID=A0A1B6GVU7_9HEMI